jgi:molybdate/tungstate transport system substrate-binding protein
MKPVFLYMILLFTAIISSCHPQGKKPISTKDNIQGDIIIFHAGSLSLPFQQIARQFETDHPGTRVLLESAGSVASARKITDLRKPCDIMASSDYQVIEQLLIPKFASWHLPFVSNELVIAFNNKSRFGKEINPGNWTEILSREEVAYGRSDPDSDPCGYRTLMAFQLAGDHYQLIELSHLLETKDQKYIRPKEVDLLALLEVGEIDYIFIYKSVAVQHGLNYLHLPAEINLGDPAMNEHYHRAVVSIRGGQPVERIDMTGEAMIYAVTIPEGGPNPKGAEAFLAYLLDDAKGLKIMEEAGQQSVVPARNIYYDKVPETLKKFALPLE